MMVRNGLFFVGVVASYAYGRELGHRAVERKQNAAEQEYLAQQKRMAHYPNEFNDATRKTLCLDNDAMQRSECQKYKNVFQKR